MSCCVLFAGPPAENNLDSSSLLKHFQVGVFFFAGAGGRQSLPSFAPPKHLPNPSNISGWTIKRLCLNGFSGLIVSPRENPHISEQKRQHSSHQLDVTVLFSPRHSGSARPLMGEHFSDCRWLPRNKLSLAMRGRRYFQTSTCRNTLGLRPTRQRSPYCLQANRESHVLS